MNEYHVIDLMTGVSHGGFVSLDAAREYTRQEYLEAWDIFNGNIRVEYHDPITANEYFGHISYQKRNPRFIKVRQEKQGFPL